MWFRHHEKKPINEQWNEYHMQRHGTPYPGYDPNRTTWITSKWHWLEVEAKGTYLSPCGFAFTVVQTKEVPGPKDHKCSSCADLVRNRRNLGV